MRRAILHIGVPRTGSTSLQFVWTRHRAALRDLGILYPDLTPAGAAPHLSHQHLLEAMDARRPDELFAQLEDQLRCDADTIILSQEILAHRNPQGAILRRLRNLLNNAGCSTKALAVVKAPAESANSHYTINTLFLRSDTDFAGHLRRWSARKPLDLSARLLPWQAACDQGLLLLPLHASPLEPLIKRVWNAAGILDRAGHLLTPEDLTRLENRSAGPVAIEACRRLAAAGLRRGHGDEQARRVTRLVEDVARARGADVEGFQGYDEALYASMEARWARSNERLAKATWGEPWSTRMRAQPLRPPNELARTGDPDGLRLVHEVLTEVCSRLDVSVPGPVPIGWWSRLRRQRPATGA